MVIVSDLAAKWKKRFPWARLKLSLLGKPALATCQDCTEISSSTRPAKRMHRTCSVSQDCNDFRCTQPTAKKLQQHAASKKHCLNSSGDAGSASAPSRTEFQNVIDELLKGTSLRRSSLGAEKGKKMLWCLDQAVIDTFLTRAKTLTTAAVSQDAQGALLSVRASFVNKSRAMTKLSE